MDNDMAERITRIETQLENDEERISTLQGITSEIHAMALEMTKLTEQVSHSNTEISEMKLQVEELRSKPAKSYDAIVHAIVSAVISCAVSLIIAYVFK